MQSKQITRFEARPAVSGDHEVLDYAALPTSHEIYGARKVHTPGRGQGFTALTMLGWKEQAITDRERRILRSSAAKLREQSGMAIVSIQNWTAVWKQLMPDHVLTGQWDGAMGDANPGGRFIAEWMHEHRSYATIADDGGVMFPKDRAPKWGDVDALMGWIHPAMPIAEGDWPGGHSPEAPPMFIDGVHTWGDFQAERFAQFAAYAGANAFHTSDYYASYPHGGPWGHGFNPAVLEVFQQQTGVTLPEDFNDAVRTIRGPEWMAWLAWNVAVWQTHVYSYIDLLQAYTDQKAYHFGQRTLPPAAIRSYGAVEPSALPALEAGWHIYILNLWWQNQTRGQNFPSTRASAFVGLYGAREPRAEYMFSGMAFRAWDKDDDRWRYEQNRGNWEKWWVRRYYPDLSQDEQEYVIRRRLDCQYGEALFTHILDDEGRVRRPVGGIEYSAHHSGHVPDRGIIDLAREHVPTAPYGPGLYYSREIERILEERIGNEGRDRRFGAYLGRDLDEITDLRPEATFGYYCGPSSRFGSDRRLWPSAWVVPHADLLSDEERGHLTSRAPILTPKDAASRTSYYLQLDGPVNRPVTGFGFFDQRGDLCLLIHELAEPGLQAIPARAVIHARCSVPNGTYAVRLDGDFETVHVDDGWLEFTVRPEPLGAVLAVVRPV